MVNESTLGTVELRIPSKAEWVAVARLAVAAVANRLQFSIEEIEDVKLAVAEACTNCIQHG
ncbi:MAG: ATP-binding protein, partial [Candidatus Eremiobacteraeota bacterium]|nr:ATP-binding protein [Candidatus Eremiobacteraeota bacterium]